MRMRLKCLVLFAVCLFALFNITVCVKAEEFVVTNDDSQDVEIYITIPSTYNLSIPKKVSLIRDTDNNVKGIYQVEMTSCDIAPTEYVCVTANSSVELTEQTSGEKGYAVNSLVHEEFRGKMSNDIRTGEISANLAAGSWTGKLVFEITLNDIEGNIVQTHTANMDINN